MNREPSEEEINTYLEKIEALIRHIENVKTNCFILGKKLVQKGDIELGRQLIANSYLHDNSKLHGVEWEYLDSGVKEKLDLAIHQHNTSPLNKHHPEAWGEEGINAMSRLFLAEMVADWKARASEFGTNLREWIKETAYPRYNIPPNGKIAKYIKEFVDLLLDEPFKQVKT